MRPTQHLFEERLGLRCYFGAKMPAAPPVPKPPAPNQAAEDVSASNTTQAKRKGYDSTVLTSGMGVMNQTSAKSTLLGG